MKATKVVEVVWSHQLADFIEEISLEMPGSSPYPHRFRLVVSEVPVYHAVLVMILIMVLKWR